MDNQRLPTLVEHKLDLADIARQVMLSRALDELEEAELAPKGEVPYQFSAKGHELAQVLLGKLLVHPHDAAGVYYRSRPFLLTVGLTLEEALAGGMGLTGSPSEGRDVGVVFSMPPRRGPTVLPASGDVGAQYTPVAGWAQAIRYRLEVLGESNWEGAVAVALGGDGSVATNGFWSALTMASTLKLPMLFFIEDNGYGLSVPNSFHTPGGDIAANLKSFKGLNALEGSGTELDEAVRLISDALEWVRGGQGPCLLRLRVPRLSGHTFIDNQAYKTEEELEEERERDPVVFLERELGREALDEIRSQVEGQVRQALEAAREHSSPDPEGATRHLFYEGKLQRVGGLSPERVQPEVERVTAPERRGPRVNLLDAVRGVMEQELAGNPRALVFGEDVGQKGGVHGATQGLQGEFGEDRVFDTSLSEEGIVGRAQGLALAGLLPLPEIQFRKYADPAAEQINDIGTLRWRTAGKFAAPMVLRIPVGFSRKIGDPWHSVTAEAVYAHTLGWRLAFPSNAADAAGLLRTALRGEDPTLFFEHRALLDASTARRPDPGPGYHLPFGHAAVLQEGNELTLITWGAMVYRALDAVADQPGRVEVIDLRTITPWDRERVMESLKVTGKGLVVHEDTWTDGFGAEILATLAQECFMDLDAPLRRLATPDVPIPYNKDLMNRVLPGVEDIRRAVEDLLAF